MYRTFVYRTSLLVAGAAAVAILGAPTAAAGEPFNISSSLRSEDGSSESDSISSSILLRLF
jgi:hypothetical protein